MQLWGIWLKGVGWAKCTMSHTNRWELCRGSSAAQNISH